MELLVKKASLVLFLKEQYLRHEREIEDIINISPGLNTALVGAQEVSGKLKVLDEEIEAHPDVALLHEIMAAGSRRELTMEELVNSLPILPKVVFEVTRGFARALNNLFGSMK